MEKAWSAVQLMW